jgi:DNA invertase Pin-like site-specific DNA recombinase
MIIGYARISTSDQNPQLQIDALRAAGCDEIADETGSGLKDRPVLMGLLGRLKPGDVLVSWKLDRLGRSAKNVLEIIEDLRGRGIEYRSITEGLDTSKPFGRFALTILAAISEMERETIVERVRAGIAARRRAGGRIGRPDSMAPEQLEHARDLVKSGRSLRETARMIGVPRSTLSDSLRRTIL